MHFHIIAGLKRYSVAASDLLSIHFTRAASIAERAFDLADLNVLKDGWCMPVWRVWTLAEVPWRSGKAQVYLPPVSGRCAPAAACFSAVLRRSLPGL